MYYSETQFYTEIKRVGDKVQLQNQNGDNIVVNTDYLNLLNSADTYNKEEKLNGTELIELILSYPRTAMSIYFQKSDKAKTKKATITPEEPKNMNLYSRLTKGKVLKKVLKKIRNINKKATGPNRPISLKISK